MHGWKETPTETTARIARWREEWGDWLKQHDWNHWVTLTVGGVWSPGRLLRVFENEFIRFATKTAQGPVPYAFAIEGGALGDRPHLHVLLAGTSELHAARLEQAWRHGRAQVAVFDPRLGAAYYLAKEIGGRVLDYGVSNRLLPLRADEAAAGY